jgi:hypothetical protein
MADEEIVILKQEDGDRLALDHDGLALYGDRERPAMQHEFAGQVVHRTLPGAPLVHVVGWDEDNHVKAELSGSVALVGDPDAPPIQVRMMHEFSDVIQHAHDVSIKPMEHTLHVASKLHEPIHHALQLRTPIQLRFCNAWHVDSDYKIELVIAGMPVISIRVRGATVVTPQPCADGECP